MSLLSGFVLLSAGPRTVAATVVEDVALSTMARDAVAVVRGRVERVGARVVVEGTGHRIETVVRVRVSEWWKGEGGTSVTLVEPGGATPFGTSVTHGAPTYAVGEDVVVFVERDPAGRSHTFGLALGRFVVRRDSTGRAWATRDLSDLALARDVRGRMAIAEGSDLETLPVVDLAAVVLEANRVEGAPAGWLR